MLISIPMGWTKRGANQLGFGLWVWLWGFFFFYLFFSSFSFIWGVKVLRKRSPMSVKTLSSCNCECPDDFFMGTRLSNKCNFFTATLSCFLVEMQVTCATGELLTSGILLSWGVCVCLKSHSAPNKCYRSHPSGSPPIAGPLCPPHKKFLYHFTLPSPRTEKLPVHYCLTTHCSQYLVLIKCWSLVESCTSDSCWLKARSKKQQHLSISNTF